MFFKKKKEIKENNAILCNRYLQTSDQLERALKNNKELNFTKIIKCQFPWVVLEEITRNDIAYLFIDKNTDSNKELNNILIKIRSMKNTIKIILLINTVDQEVIDMKNEGLIDRYLLMPFQDSHVNMCIQKILSGEEIEL